MCNSTIGFGSIKSRQEHTIRQVPLGTDTRREKSCFSTSLFKGGGLRGGVFFSLPSVTTTKHLLPVPVACYIHANCREVLDPGKGR